MLHSQELHTNEVSLIPKLRDNFAEFLNEGYLERFRILSLPTCVGLWYGHLVLRLEVFLGSLESRSSLTRRIIPLIASALRKPGFTWIFSLRVRTETTNALHPYLSTSPHHDSLN